MPPAPATNLAALHAFVAAAAQHLGPDTVRWCTDDDADRRANLDTMVANGTLVPLDASAHPGSYLHRSDPSDVARTEHLTFISTRDPADVGATNNWMSQADAEARVWPLLAGAMRGRTMYVVPYLMGPVGSPYARAGVQVTDSPYVVENLRIMTRIGRAALELVERTGVFVRGIHSLGDLSPERRFVVHFPERREIWSVGSGYGGNALLSKKCHALRIASVEARDEGWLAEHMLIVGLTSPRGKTHYVAAAFPSACGKTNLAMLVPTAPGWTVETVGDDIAWLHPGPDGRLWAINPENGMFGVAPGTSLSTNPNALRSLDRDVIFTNVALRSGRRVFWEGLSDLEPGEELVDWRGLPWVAGTATTPAAHPNARFTAPLAQCPSALSRKFDKPSGVPISAIVFGGRRRDTMPLVLEAESWAHGVYVGATMASETTAAATGAVGVLRNDPMAMLPFCGYDMARYFGHWLSMQKRVASPPRIFHVNWFRRDAEGRFLWPGFGHNVRVLEWILDRVDGVGSARETPVGLVPFEASIDVRGVDVTERDMRELLSVDVAGWRAELARSEAFLKKLGDGVPAPLWEQHARLALRLQRAN